MFYKISLCLFVSSVLILFAISVGEPAMPTFNQTFSEICGNGYFKTWIVCFLILIMLYPFVAVCNMFLYTGKFLYLEKEELLLRFGFFIKTVCLHNSAMIFLHSSMAAMTILIEGNLFVTAPYTKIVMYLSSIFTLFLTILSTSLKIPLIVILIEYAIIFETNVQMKRVFRKSRVPLVISTIAFLFSVYFELRTMTIFKQYILSTYKNIDPRLDLFTDTAYSTAMFTCFYSLALTYYRIW